MWMLESGSQQTGFFTPISFVDDDNSGYPVNTDYAECASSLLLCTWKPLASPTFRLPHLVTLTHFLTLFLATYTHTHFTYKHTSIVHTFAPWTGSHAYAACLCMTNVMMGHTSWLQPRVPNSTSMAGPLCCSSNRDVCSIKKVTADCKTTIYPADSIMNKVGFHDQCIIRPPLLFAEW